MNTSVALLTHHNLCTLQRRAGASGRPAAAAMALGRLSAAGAMEQVCGRAPGNAASHLNILAMQPPPASSSREGHGAPALVTLQYSSSFVLQLSREAAA